MKLSCHLNACIIQKINNLNEQFFYGLLSGAILALSIILQIRGLDALLGLNQIHYITLEWLLIIALFSFHKLEGHANLSRILQAFFFMMFIFQVHDLFWMFDAYRVGIVLNDLPIFYPQLDYLIVFIPRALFLMLVSIVYIYKDFRIAKTFFIFFPFQVAYHILVTTFSVSYPIPNIHFVVTQIFDTLPYLELVKKTES